MSTAIDYQEAHWLPLCQRQDLVPDSGIVARIDHQQVAVFYLQETQQLYAVDNHDPFSGANVIGRGIIGHLHGTPVIASPLYKQHFRLTDGVCLEHPQQRLRTWPIRFNGDAVEINNTHETH